MAWWFSCTRKRKKKKETHLLWLLLWSACTHTEETQLKRSEKTLFFVAFLFTARTRKIERERKQFVVTMLWVEGNSVFSYELEISMQFFNPTSWYAPVSKKKNGEKKGAVVPTHERHDRRKPLESKWTKLRKKEVGLESTGEGARKKREKEDKKPTAHVRSIAEDSMKESKKKSVKWRRKTTSVKHTHTYTHIYVCMCTCFIFFFYLSTFEHVLHSLA